MHKYGITCPIPGLKNLSYYRIRNLHEAPVVDIGQIDLIREKKIKVCISRWVMSNCFYEGSQT